MTRPDALPTMTTMPAVVLLPCPFCGSADIESDTSRYYRAITSRLIGKAAAINCNGCDAEMMRCYADMPDVPRDDVMADLIETWNRRPHLDALQRDAAGGVEERAYIGIGQ